MKTEPSTVVVVSLLLSVR